MPRLGEVARRRQREADDAALRGGVGDLADLAVEGGDRGGVDADAALAVVVGLVVVHRRGGEAQHVEGADQVDLDHVGEDLEVVRPLLGDRALRPADPGAADRDPQLAAARAPRRPPPATCSGSITFASTKLAPLAELAGQRLALLGVEVGDHDARAVARAGAARSPRRARRPRRRRARCFPRPSSARAYYRTMPVRAWVPAIAPTAQANLRRADRRPPRGGARAHPAAGRAADRGAAQPRLLADPQPARLGPRPHRQLRGALAGPASRRPRADATASSGASTTRSRTRARPATSCRSCAATSCAPTWTRSASARSTCSTASSSSDADDPLLRDGFVYELILAHEHQHNETMLQLLQMVDGYEPSSVDAAVAARAGRRRPGDGRGRGRSL